MSSKKYGLILSDKGQQQRLTFQASRNVFGNDSDSEEEAKKKPILLRPSDIISRQAKITQEKAILDDPTVYQYDEIYDEVISKKEKEKVKNKEDKKPRYIENLMKSASKRKIESERRIERQIQKEREKEGDEFKDKEVFVTSAYKKKLEEMKLEEEKEKREEYLESIGDVTKQRDLGGFYRHLYEQKLGEIDKNTECKEQCSSVPEKEIIETPNETKAETDLSEKSNKRNYRKRKTSSENTNNLSDGEIEDSDEEINRVNLEDIRMAKKHKKSDENIDADSDFSTDASSEEETDKIKEGTMEAQSEDLFKKPTPTNSVKKLIPKAESAEVNSSENSESTKVEAEPKIDIWKKRTVGVVFEEALKRYYERKAARGC